MLSALDFSACPQVSHFNGQGEVTSADEGCNVLQISTQTKEAKGFLGNHYLRTPENFFDKLLGCKVCILDPHVTEKKLYLLHRPQIASPTPRLEVKNQ